LFSWLDRWRDDERCGVLEAIYIAPTAGVPMQRVADCECLPGRGLVGDRYAAGAGHWIKTDGCEVTLVRSEDIDRASRRGPVDFRDGAHRRNLVVSGIPIPAYRRRRVRIGEVLFEFHRLRPPCGYLDRVVGRGAARGLGDAAGIGLRVIEAGRLRVGDRAVLVEDPADRAS
jgi:MOSC domain-containing protein YiiM